MAEERTWHVLNHFAGPAVPDGESAFAGPGLAELPNDAGQGVAGSEATARPWRVVRTRADAP